MSWQNSYQFQHFDSNHELPVIPVQDFDLFGSYPSDYPAWDSDYQYASDISLDPFGATALSTNEWTQFNDSQVRSCAEEAAEDIIPTIEDQNIITESSTEEKELRELRQQVSHLKDRLETLQKTWEEYKERLCVEIAANVKRIEEWNIEVKQIVDKIAREAKVD